MFYNKESGYGSKIFHSSSGLDGTLGRTFIVCGTTSPNYQALSEIFIPDNEGNIRIFNTFTAALAATTALCGDNIVIDPYFTTAPTLTELATAYTNNVQITYGNVNTDGSMSIFKATSTLPASAYGALFTVTGAVRLVDVVGEVTTAIQAQATTCKITATPTVGSAVDLCSTLDLTGSTVGTLLNITGTLATAMVKNANGVMVAQATPIVVPAGTVGLTTVATSTGSIRWMARYVPLYPGAFMF